MNNCMRDPRINPAQGDIIIQCGSTSRITVVSVKDNVVSWREEFKKKMPIDNSWSVKGWINIVAKNSKVIRVRNQLKQIK